MNWWFILIPVISAFLGWILTRSALKLLFHPRIPKKILGISIQGVLPKNQPALASKIGIFVSQELFSFEAIEQKIGSSENLEKIMPVIEKQLDDFLRVKLTAEMPFLSVFIGDKTIASLKKVFIQELKILFPQIMKSYAANLRDEFDPGRVVSGKVATFPPDKLEIWLHQNLRREFRAVKVAGAVLGFVIGLFQVLLTLAIS